MTLAVREDLAARSTSGWSCAHVCDESCSTPSGVCVRAFVAEHREGATLEEIAAVFGLTRERVRQIEADALRKLRAEIALEDGDDLADEQHRARRRPTPGARARAAHARRPGCPETAPGEIDEQSEGGSEPASHEATEGARAVDPAELPTLGALAVLLERDPGPEDFAHVRRARPLHEPREVLALDAQGHAVATFPTLEDALRRSRSAPVRGARVLVDAVDGRLLATLGAVLEDEEAGSADHGGPPLE